MGDNVTAVGRDIDGEDVMQGWHARCQGLVCDVRVRKTVELVMEKAKGRWGRVDIIAKYVQIIRIELLPRKVFDSLICCFWLECSCAGFGTFP